MRTMVNLVLGGIRTRALAVSVLLIVTAAVTAEARYKYEDNVLILTEAEFDHAVRDFPRLLVLFHAPWCGICRGFMKDYKKAATLLRHENSDIVLATVNGHVEKALTRRFKLPGFPVVRFYKSGMPSKYTGGRGAKNLVMWLKSQ